MQDPRILRVQEFRSLRKNDPEAARRLVGDDPRVWYGERQGEGLPWNPEGKGRWSEWDAHFRSGGDILLWEQGADHVASIHSEMNDYFRLLDRNGSWYRRTWFFDSQGRISGYMISGWEDAPATTDRGDDFQAWAAAHHAQEWAYLRPGGKLDPTGDRAARTRVLLEQWRRAAGLPELHFSDTAGFIYAEHEEFWKRWQSLCGQSFAGKVEHNEPPDADLDAQPLVMHVRRCGEDEIRIPFHIGDNRSRTWVLRRTALGLRFKHEHRHENGDFDSITDYGGDAIRSGTATRQRFPADRHTAQLLPAARTNVWTVDLDEARMLYELERVGTTRAFRARFDLTRPVANPPAPWGHSD